MASGLQRVQAAYVKAIREGAARTLWLTSYADWAEEHRDDDASGIDRPGPGGDWDDFAPETPRAAFQAADDLFALYEAANGMKIIDLFQAAMIAEYGEDFQWVKYKDEVPPVPNLATLRKLAEITLVAEPETDTTPEESFGYDTDEENREAAQHVRALAEQTVWGWCHVIVTATYDGVDGWDGLGACSYESEEDFRAEGATLSEMVTLALDRLQDALVQRARKMGRSTPVLFGHYLAMTGMGAGSSWFDDHKPFALETPLGFEVTLDLYIQRGQEEPYFELSWSGRDRAPFEKSTRVGKTKSFPQ